MTMKHVGVLALAMGLVVGMTAAAQPEGEGWVSMFNGEDLTGWRTEAPEDWSVVDGVIDCDPTIGPGDRSLWSEESLSDFELHVEWRFKETSGDYPMPVVLPDGSHAVDDDGNVVTIMRPNADSGIFLRGLPKAQVNIWCWPIGSGEVYGYRMDANMPAEVRAGVTPLGNADKPVGEWNTFLITMHGDNLTVVLNGVRVIDDVPLPDVPAEGPIALQHHGGLNPETGERTGADSLIEFRNIYYRPIDGE